MDKEEKAYTDKELEEDSKRLFRFLEQAKCSDDGKMGYVIGFAKTLRNAYFSEGHAKGVKMGKEICFDDLKEKLGNIIYRELAFLYQKDGLSVPCKDRETVKNKILSELEIKWRT